MIDEECNCDCHKNSESKHTCCTQCPYCQKHITNIFAEQHIKECQSSRSSVMAEAYARIYGGDK